MKSVLFKMKKECKSKKFFFCPVIVVFVFCFFAMLLDVVSAQEKYPIKPINLIIGYAAGGPTEITVRGIATAASKHLGQPFVLLSKPGGDSALSLGIIKDQKPDGYNIGFISTNGIIASHVRNVNYDTVKDFTPIIQYAEALSAVAVRSDSPWKTWRELIEYARANPGKIRYSSSGPGSPQSLVMGQVAIREKIKWTNVPFEGTAPAATALLGGHVEVVAGTITWKPYVDAGRFRVLASLTTPLPFAPNAPTSMELYGIDCSISLFITGPKGISPEIVEILHGAFKKAMDDPDFLRACESGGTVPKYRSTEESARFIVKLNEDFKSWLKDAGLLKKE